MNPSRRYASIMFAFLPGIPGADDLRTLVRRWTTPGIMVCPTAVYSNWITGSAR